MAKIKVQKGKVVYSRRSQITSYLGKLVNDHGYETSIYYSLHLLLVTCCYIGQEPHCLLQGRTDTSQMYSKTWATVLYTATGEISGVIYEIRQVSVWVSSCWLYFTRMGSDGKCVCVCVCVCGVCVCVCVCVCLTLLIFSLGCVSRLAKWERHHSWAPPEVCSSRPC